MYIVNFTTIAILIIFTTLFGCSIGESSAYHRSNSKIESSGWVSSESGDKKSPDSFYFKLVSSADNSIKNGAKKEFSCRATALESAKLIASEKISENIHTYPNSLTSDLHLAVKEVKAKECKPVGKIDSQSPFGEWSQCECIVTVKVESNQKANLFAKVYR